MLSAKFPTLASLAQEAPQKPFFKQNYDKQRSLKKPETEPGKKQRVGVP
jgi:hypothetical protein